MDTRLRERLRDFFPSQTTKGALVAADGQANKVARQNPQRAGLFKIFVPIGPGPIKQYGAPRRGTALAWWFVGIGIGAAIDAPLSGDDCFTGILCASLSGAIGIPAGIRHWRGQISEAAAVPRLAVGVWANRIGRLISRAGWHDSANS